MKNWLTIGQFAKEVAISQKALRVYEKAGLIKAHSRGDNRYRYYTVEQIQTVEKIKQFKLFGFSLNDIRTLLDADMNREKLKSMLEDRLCFLQTQEIQNQTTQRQIQKILSSFNKAPLNLQERKLIMIQLEKLSVVVAGVTHLKETATFIQSHISNSGKSIPVIVWDGKSKLPQKKPFILVIPEPYLHKSKVKELDPDIVVIKELSGSSADLQNSYLQLYSSVGPQMATILNADDRAVVELAAHETIRKGKTYYFSKNSGLQSQIRRIGGVLSDGENIEIYGMNHKRETIEIKLQQLMGYAEEIAYLASLAAVMDFGLKEDHLKA